MGTSKFGTSKLILGIETSCDETAAAVVADGNRVISSVVSSQIDLHSKYGGVVPEVASRAHVELMIPVINEALIQANLDGFPNMGKTVPDAIAVTVGPGLVGSLLVGVSAAKTLAAIWGVPFIPINHLEGHLYAAFLEEPDLIQDFPLVVLLASGGHTALVEMKGHGDYILLGETIDDAAGEAFDKVGRILNLGYPGGPSIDKASMGANPDAIKFPRSLIKEGFDFSFSGLKTSVLNFVKKNPGFSIPDIAASFQEAVVDVLVTKTARAIDQTGAKGLCLAGGVAANSRLREKILDICIEKNVRPFLPSPEMCTDNAAMIAAAGYWRLNEPDESLSIGVDPSMKLVTK